MSRSDASGLIRTCHRTGVRRLGSPKLAIIGFPDRVASDMLARMLDDLTARLLQSQDLDGAAIVEAVKSLADPSRDVESKAAFLTALSRKGETPAELAGFARELRALSTPVPVSDAVLAGEILDVCGTGGDRLNTFNISTTVAILCSAAGCVVAKHGNRAITSQAGSADVLQALGIPIELPQNGLRNRWNGTASHSCSPRCSTLPSSTSAPPDASAPNEVSGRCSTSWVRC